VIHIAYLSLGSNIGDRAANIAEALRRLREAGAVTAVSSLYETSPVEVTDQPWFFNAAAKLETELEPEALMTLLLNLERAMGRQRDQPKGPRNIDLDILLYDECVVHSDSVDVPHPAMQLRRFVLVPLAEIAPHALHPVLLREVREILADLKSTDVVRRFDGKKDADLSGQS
jgi:2-amino-4-hydroxy-6-hydroxymethyldihydropteridine diphosphokinase